MKPHKGKPVAKPVTFKNPPSVLASAAGLQSAAMQFAAQQSTIKPLNDSVIAEATAICPKTITYNGALSRADEIKWRAEGKAFFSCYADLSRQYGLDRMTAEKTVTWGAVKRHFRAVVSIPAKTLVELKLKIDLLAMLPEYLVHDCDGLDLERLLPSIQRDVARLALDGAERWAKRRAS